MTNYALLNNVDHKDTRVITARAAEYGDNIMFAPTFPAEFRDIQSEYPILFHRDAEGEPMPVALFGFERDENLFLDNDGWHAGYVPAMMRRQPFLIGFQAQKNAAESEPLRVLSLDMDHPRISTSEGEALFQPLGGRTPFLEDMASLLEGIHTGHEHGKGFVAALRENQLLETVTMEITLKDGSRNQLLGFHTIDEGKVRELPESVLGHFSQAGYLMPLFMALASLGNIRKLVDLKNRGLGT